MHKTYTKKTAGIPTDSLQTQALLQTDLVSSTSLFHPLHHSNLQLLEGKKRTYKCCFGKHIVLLLCCSLTIINLFEKTTNIMSYLYLISHIKYSERT